MQEYTSDALVGTLVDNRYLIRSKLARGGMSTVYLATDRRLERDVALKLLHPHMAGDPQFLDRLGREAKAAAKLSHPHVVGVLDQGEVYQVIDVSYRDMDASALGLEKGVTPFLDKPARLVLPYVIPGLPRASLSSGGNVVSGFGYDGILAQMVDMETYSVVRVADRFGIPVIGLRGIFDGHAELTEMNHWSASLEDLDRKLAEAVDMMAAAVEGEALPL